MVCYALKWRKDCVQKSKINIPVIVANPEQKKPEVENTDN
jgi:hypothetical protein